jgi:hypothetical protein
LVVIVYLILGALPVLVYVIVNLEFVQMAQVVMELVHVLKMPMDPLVNPVNV